MNLFILDRLPNVAAQFYNDKHVIKIILEAVQMMSFAYDFEQFKTLPNLQKNVRYINHPMSLWVRESRQNFDWTLQHTFSLLDEFLFRTNNKKDHAYKKHVEWIAQNIPIDLLPNIGQTDWPRCFGDYKEQIPLSDDAVYDYRRYYMLAKRHIAKWTRRPTPFWWK